MLWAARSCSAPLWLTSSDRSSPAWNWKLWPPSRPYTSYNHIYVVYDDGHPFIPSILYHIICIYIILHIIIIYLTISRWHILSICIYTVTQLIKLYSLCIFSIHYVDAHRLRRCWSPGCWAPAPASRCSGPRPRGRAASRPPRPAARGSRCAARKRRRRSRGTSDTSHRASVRRSCSRDSINSLRYSI